MDTNDNPIFSLDLHGRWWPKDMKLCAHCGQPDNCGDCTHEKLAEKEVLLLGGLLEETVLRESLPN